MRCAIVVTLIRIVITSLFSLSFCFAPLFSQEESAKRIPIKLVGVETSLLRVKAAPREFLNKPFVITGGIRIGDYYNFGYDDAEESHYSLEFWQADTPTTLGENCTIYLRRAIGREIVDTIVSKTGPKKVLRVRAKVMLDSLRFEDNNWRMLELIDVQFPTADSNDWQPWFFEAARQEVMERSARWKQEAIEAERQKQKELAKQLAARTRTWTSATGRFSVVAEYRGMTGGEVLLKRKDGKVIKVPPKKLSDADQNWLNQRRKSTNR